MDTTEFFEEYGNPTTEQLEIAAKLSEVFEDVKKSYEEAYNINERLEYDDLLQNEYYAYISLLTMMEAVEDEHDDPEMVEHAYLKTIDSLIRLAKVIHPISGFGRERLESAYELLDAFQEVYHPILTIITKDNIEAFANLFSEKEYDEVYYNRKKAIGILRLEGKDTYAAGVATYRIENAPVLNTPVIHLDYLYVHSDFRSFGTGNLLMAAVIRPALSNPDARVVLSYRPIGTSDDDDDDYATAIENEFDIIEEFLSSWRFDFSIDFSRDFYVTLKDANEAPFINISTKGVKSINQLGSHAEYLIKDYMKQNSNLLFNELKNTPFDYYDKDASCVYMEEGNISSILLCHRYPDGDYRLNHLRSNPEAEITSVMRLLKFAYNECLEKSGTECMISGESFSEEGYLLLQKLAPKAKCMIVFDGILTPLLPSETLSTEQWDMLRKEAGYESIDKPDENDLSSLDDAELDKAFEELLNTFS